MTTLVPRCRMLLHSIQQWASETLCQGVSQWTEVISVAPEILHQVAWWVSPSTLGGFPGDRGYSFSQIHPAMDSVHNWFPDLFEAHSLDIRGDGPINLLEMEEVPLSVRASLLYLEFRVVQLICNNIMVVVYIRKSFRLTCLIIWLSTFLLRENSSLWKSTSDDIRSQVINGELFCEQHVLHSDLPVNSNQPALQTQSQSSFWNQICSKKDHGTDIKLGGYINFGTI